MAVSNNNFSKSNLPVVQSQWQGDNIGGTAYGTDDLYSGTPYGISVYGGFSHFNARTQPAITH